MKKNSTCCIIPVWNIYKFKNECMLITSGKTSGGSHEVIMPQPALVSLWYTNSPGSSAAIPGRQTPTFCHSRLRLIPMPEATPTLTHLWRLLATWSEEQQCLNTGDGGWGEGWGGLDLSNENGLSVGGLLCRVKIQHSLILSYVITSGYSRQSYATVLMELCCRGGVSWPSVRMCGELRRWVFPLLNTAWRTGFSPIRCVSMNRDSLLSDCVDTYCFLMILWWGQYFIVICMFIAFLLCYRVNFSLL